MNFHSTIKNSCCDSSCYSGYEKFVLALVIISSFSLRFYQLETPSMWWDEILVPMTARYPLEYIFEWARRLEVNSPYYILLVKMNLLVGRSDFCLRLLSALAGVGAVYAIAQFGRSLINKEAGIIAAILLANWPLHVLLSRQLRPYALFSLVLIFSMWRLFVFCEERCNLLRNTVFLAVSYVLLFALHYMAVPVVLSHGVFVFLIFIYGETSVKQLISFVVAAIIGFLPVFPFFVGTFLQRKDMILAGHNYFEVIKRLLSSLYHVNFSFVSSLPLDYILPDSVLSLVCGAFFLLFICLFCFFRSKNCRYPIFYPLAVFTPLTFFVLARQQIWRPRHMSFLIPLFVLIIAGFSSRLIYKKNSLMQMSVYLFMIFVLALPCIFLHAENLYFSESYPDVYKSQARQISSLLHGGDPVVVDSLADFNALSWYLEQYSENNPLQHQLISNNANNALLHFLIPENFGSNNVYQIELLERMGKIKSKVSLSKATILNYELERSPVSHVKANELVAFSAKPWFFYKNVSELSNLTCQWKNDPIIHPTLNDTLGSFVKHYNLDSKDVNFLIEGEFESFSSGKNNIINETIYVDNSRFHVGKIEEKQGKFKDRFKIMRFNTIKRISFQVDMVCGDKTPSYAGSNIDTVGFHGLNFVVTPLRQMHWGSLSLLESFTGLDPVENSPEGSFRWGHGPETVCSFDLKDNEKIILKFSINNILPDQEILVCFNGEVVKTISNLKPQKWISEVSSYQVDLFGKAGHNVVSLKYKKYNGLSPENTFAPKDPRPLAVAFTEFLVENELLPVQEDYLLN